MRILQSQFSIILVLKAAVFIHIPIAIQDWGNLDNTTLTSMYRLNFHLQVTIRRTSYIYAEDSRFPNLQPPRPVLKAPKAPNAPGCPAAWLPSPSAEVGLATETDPRSLLLNDDLKPDWGKEKWIARNLLCGGRS